MVKNIQQIGSGLFVTHVDIGFALFVYQNTMGDMALVLNVVSVHLEHYSECIQILSKD